jgi:hypothetical protein
MFFRDKEEELVRNWAAVYAKKPAGSLEPAGLNNA